MVGLRVNIFAIFIMSARSGIHYRSTASPNPTKCVRDFYQGKQFVL